MQLVDILNGAVPQDAQWLRTHNSFLKADGIQAISSVRARSRIDIFDRHIQT
jgi:hypothetical protein